MAKIISVEKWVRQADGAKMEIQTIGVNRGIKQKMYINGVKVMSTFSRRPYKLRQGCDGTIDDCVHALFIDFCRSYNLDPLLLYAEAYPNNGSDYVLEAQARILENAEKQGVEYPKVWNKNAFEGLCESLHEINNHSLVGIIENIEIVDKVIVNTV